MHFNIRRGLSVAEVVDKSTKKVTDYKVMRKGLHKFFDLHLE